MYWFIFLPLTALLMVFTVENKGIVEVSLWPLPYLVSLPLSLVILGVFFIGFLIGSFYAWSLHYKKRRELKNVVLQNKMLSSELEILKAHRNSMKDPLEVDSY